MLESLCSVTQDSSSTGSHNIRADAPELRPDIYFWSKSNETWLGLPGLKNRQEAAKLESGQAFRFYLNSAVLRSRKGVEKKTVKGLESEGAFI
jgi:hypothetical protein